MYSAQTLCRALTETPPDNVCQAQILALLLGREERIQKCRFAARHPLRVKSLIAKDEEPVKTNLRTKPLAIQRQSMKNCFARTHIKERKERASLLLGSPKRISTSIAKTSTMSPLATTVGCQPRLSFTSDEIKPIGCATRYLSPLRDIRPGKEKFGTIQEAISAAVVSKNRTTIPNSINVVAVPRRCQSNSSNPSFKQEKPRARHESAVPQRPQTLTGEHQCQVRQRYEDIRESRQQYVEHLVHLTKARQFATVSSVVSSPSPPKLRQKSAPCHPVNKQKGLVARIVSHMKPQP